jgi:hypothetical protein
LVWFWSGWSGFGLVAQGFLIEDFGVLDVESSNSSISGSLEKRFWGFGRRKLQFFHQVIPGWSGWSGFGLVGLALVWLPGDPLIEDLRV